MQYDLQVHLCSFSKIDQEARNNIELLCQLIYSWNKKVNLISRKDISDIVPNHVIPSLAISLVKQFQPNDRIIDVGTGGGFPGLPMAIIYPKSNFTLLDSSTVKMNVLRDVVRTLNMTNVHIVTSRAENFYEKYDYIFGRSVKALPHFLSFSSHLLNSVQTINNTNIQSSSGLYYIKGGNFTVELQEAEIQNCKISPIIDLVPTLQTDKCVLFVSNNEIKRN